MARKRSSSSHIPPFEGEGTILDTSIVEEIESSYLDYSYSVIYSRALIRRSSSFICFSE